MNTIKLGDMLTTEQLERCRALYPDRARIRDEVIKPNLEAINRKLGQENDADCLSYAIVYAIEIAERLASSSADADTDRFANERAEILANVPQILEELDLVPVPSELATSLSHLRLFVEAVREHLHAVDRRSTSAKSTPKRRRRVYLESPFYAVSSEGLHRNMEYLRRCMLDSMARGEAPLASHAVFTQFLDDGVPEERAIGMACGFAWAAFAETTVVYADLGISSGMQLGIDDARANGRPVVFREIGAQQG